MEDILTSVEQSSTKCLALGEQSSLPALAGTLQSKGLPQEIINLKNTLYEYSPINLFNQ